MSGPGHDDLMQGEIDGVNSAADSSRLRELLSASPDLEARYVALRNVSDLLGRAERLEPPAGFADGVMSAVRRPAPTRPARPGWRDLLRSVLSPAPLAACACTLLLGVVVGGLLPPDSRLFSGSERAALSGTAVSSGRLAGAGTLDRKVLALNGVRGEAVIRNDAGLLVVDLDLDTTRPVDVSLELATTGLSLRSFTRDGLSGGDVVLAEGQLRFSHPAGKVRYGLSFSRGGPAGRTLRLRVGDGEGWNLSLDRGRPR